MLQMKGYTYKALIRLLRLFIRAGGFRTKIIKIIICYYKLLGCDTIHRTGGGGMHNDCQLE